MKREKCYIAGKVSGLEYADVERKFAAAAFILARRGYEPINPTKLCNPKWGWWRCMAVCLWNLLKCDCIFLLHDWSDSRGARVEKKLAEFFGIRFIEMPITDRLYLHNLNRRLYDGN